MGFTRAKVKMPLLCVVDLKAYTYAVRKNFFKNSSRIAELFVEFSVYCIEMQKINGKLEWNFEQKMENRETFWRKLHLYK